MYDDGFESHVHCDPGETSNMIEVVNRPPIRPPPRKRSFREPNLDNEEAVSYVTAIKSKRKHHLLTWFIVGLVLFAFIAIIASQVEHIYISTVCCCEGIYNKMDNISNNYVSRRPKSSQIPL